MKKFQQTVGLLRRLAAALAALALAVAPAVRGRADESPSLRNELQPGDQAESVADGGMDRLFVPRWRLTDGPQMRAAFRDVVKEASAATVRVQCDGKSSALGGVIDSDGWIVTKATPLCGNLSVLLEDGRTLAATTVAESSTNDLALLKVEATGLPALKLSDAPAPAVGSFLASVGRSRDPVAVGVVSVPPRTIPAQPAVLGVQLDEENKPLVLEVFPGSGADVAGVKSGDLVVLVDGKETPTREKLISLVRGYNPGDDVELVVDREGERLTLKATLGGSFPGISMGRNEFQNNLGGKLSVRRFGFPSAFQHDTVLRPSDCGGPVVDLDGRVVGFNIARAGRTESYALPVGAVRTTVAQLMVKNSPRVEVKSSATTPDDTALPAAK